jgi:hypothetical protein
VIRTLASTENPLFCQASMSAAALAGECHDESRAARHADRAGEAEAEDAALEIAAEFILDVSRHGPLPRLPSCGKCQTSASWTGVTSPRSGGTTLAPSSGAEPRAVTPQTLVKSTNVSSAMPSR